MEKNIQSKVTNIFNKINQKTAELETLKSGIKKAQDEAGAAQKASDDAIRTGDNAAYLEAAESLRHAQDTKNFLEGRKKLLESYPALSNEEYIGFLTDVRKAAEAEDKKAIQQLGKLLEEVKKIELYCKKNLDEWKDILEVAHGAAKKEGIAPRAGDVRIMQYCHQAIAEYERMFVPKK